MNSNTSEMQAVRCVLPKEIPLTSGVFLSLKIVQQDQAGSLHFCSEDGLGIYLKMQPVLSSDVNRHTVYIVIGIIVSSQIAGGTDGESFRYTELYHSGPGEIACASNCIVPHDC